MTMTLSTSNLLERLRSVRPRTRAELRAWIETFFGVQVPDHRCCSDHCSPMDYLTWAFLGEGHVGGAEGSCRDAIVWACRGGGKTHLGALATLLELVFLPRCRVRILGGSEAQSQRMYDYLTERVNDGFASHLEGKVTARGCRFANGADVQVLAQSDRSVRGQHVQRLRCDEIELFDPAVWQAAQFTTHSAPHIPARLEVFSTMHRPFGLMHELIAGASQNGMRLFKWCLWEVIEKCIDRDCSTCPLWEDCRGRAKNADGYFKIDDAIAIKRRSSRRAWLSEMLCQIPQTDELVFPEFLPTVHVREVGYNPNLPLYRAIDFGYTHPLACLFIQGDQAGNIFVIDEHLKSHTTLQMHAQFIKERYPQHVEATYVDPAGRQRREITGTSVITELAALGIPCACRPSAITDGLELIRTHLAPSVGPAKLFVSPKCEHLIRAFGALRYAKLPNGQLSELPHKDGTHDHLVDALRYYFVNTHNKPWSVLESRY